MHHVRENRAGGGVSLFIQCDHEFNIRHDISLKSETAEVQSVVVKLLGVSVIKNIIVGVIYRTS